MEFVHRSVLREEVIGGLCLKPNGIYFDGTLGGAGHASEILKREPTARLVATDKDEDALAAARERLAPYEGRFTLFHADFKDYERVLDAAGVELLDGFLLDLGLSSPQIDRGERGFSYLKREAPLDMRMDRTSDFSAKEVVNGYDERSLARILRDYGEERYASVIAKRIVSAREKHELTTCGELAQIAEEAYPPKFRTPACARQTFQAIRIEVNGELEGLGECVKGLTRRLKTGGRACIITFHSLEDRIVKRAFAEMSASCTCPPSFPVCVCGKVKEIELVNGKPITAGAEELKENSRSKSAKLRIAQKIPNERATRGIGM